MTAFHSDGADAVLVATITVPSAIRTGQVGRATVGSSRHRPERTSYTCLYIGEATVSRPPRLPMMPRAMTLAPLTGS